LLLWSFNLAFALTKSQKAAILAKFNEQEKDMIFETQIDFWDFSAWDLFNAHKRISIYDNIRKKVSTSRSDIEAKRKQVVNEILDLEQAVKDLDEQTKDLEKEIIKINSNIVSTKQKIRENEKKIEILNKRVQETTDVLLKYTVYLYKKWNLVLDDGKIDNLKAIILSWENLDEILNDMYYKELIWMAWKQLIKKHKKYIFSLYSEKQELEQASARLKKLRKDFIIKKKILEDKKKYKEKILSVSKWKNSLYLKYIKDKINIEKKLRIRALWEKIKFNNISKSLLGKYWCKFVDITKNTREYRNLTPKCLELNKMIYAEGKLKWFINDYPNIFDWPVIPSKWISAYYKDPEYKKDLGEDHYAIDIVANQWTPIVAPADWYVISLKEPNSPDYAFLALKHANWFVTVYGHVSKINVDKYDFVHAGDIIWETWWEYWTNWAWIITTGPHLHFEVFKDQEHRDPLEFLNLSILDYKKLPKKYKFKYYTDYREKTWQEFKDKDLKWRKVFKIEWDTEIERQKYLLHMYAAPAFNNWDMWIEEALNWNIDPTFMMCIWLAETGLWNHLKTPYNVGNIWNTDSGWTWDFPNARAWVYWMWKTLNNKILGRYNKLSQLSRYWNKTWPIYASSDNHWHNNIVKCMSAIKWRYVADDFNFRIK